ncbi:MAG: tRNA pseudouridine(55) synthase TruB [Proteobacteria bacterium]|nr:MAG: tRNA pseudouridine(55) synthase TruB [Pseudomonadota bacterium]
MPRPKTGKPLDGIVLLDKPLGLSSNAALQRVKRLFNARKAGHTGSLDPLATGVLPICFGEATKVSSLLLDSDKRYTAIATLGETRRTGDKEGDVLETREIPTLSQESIEAVLAQFRGDIEQIPPMHSALKHEGTPLYKLARKGVSVARKTRQVHIYELNLLAYTTDTLTLDVKCSKGTYIRTLVEDIGEALGCGAHLSYLRRTEVFPFAGHTIYTMQTLEALAEKSALADTLLSTDTAIAHWPMLNLSEHDTQRLCHGLRVTRDNLPDAAGIRLYDPAGKFIGIGQRHASGQLAAKRLMRTN